jgi:hypothetical protein
MNHGEIATMAVHDIPPPLSHFEEDSPLLLAWMNARLVGDVVAVIDDHRYLREQHEVRLRQGDGTRDSGGARLG